MVLKRQIIEGNPWVIFTCEAIQLFCDQPRVYYNSRFHLYNIIMTTHSVTASAVAAPLVIVGADPSVTFPSISHLIPCMAHSSCDAALCFAFFLLDPFPVPVTVWT